VAGHLAECVCAAVIMLEGRVVEERMISGTATSPYVPGLMALRLGPLMEQAVRALSAFALHLGAELDLAT
jgi:deoxyinosine 3'endonuclease (endonuclease V)